MFHKDTRHVYRSKLLERLKWLDHGFGTRFSDGWLPVRPATLRQIHSAICVLADGESGCLGEGDALVTGRPGQYVAIKTADCVPILMADERLRAVAAVHAGWRGTVQGIVRAAVAAMQERFGTRPADLNVAIGPSICGACYEVGPEVAHQFRSLFPERQDLNGRTRLDLAEANRRQLLSAGIPADRISSGGLCTYSLNEEFFSYRRGLSISGRMMSGIGIHP